MSENQGNKVKVYIVCNEYDNGMTLSAYLSLEETNTEVERIMREWAELHGVENVQDRDKLEAAYNENDDDDSITIEPVEFTPEEWYAAMLRAEGYKA